MTRLLRRAEAIGRGAHACTVFSSDDEHRRALRGFVRCGLDSGEQVLYFTDRSVEDAVRLLDGAGVGAAAALATEQLTVMGIEESYLAEVPFSSERMLEVLRQAVDGALARGFTGVRFTGDMGWVTGGGVGLEEALTYERMVGDVLGRRPASALCQYDGRGLPGDVADAVVDAHGLRLVPDRGDHVPDVEVLPGGRDLALHGELDLHNITMLMAAVDQVAMAPGIRHVWASDVEFIDVHSVRELVRLYAGPGTLVVHQPPRLLEMILQTCWPHAAEVRT